MSRIMKSPAPEPASEPKKERVVPRFPPKSKFQKALDAAGPDPKAAVDPDEDPDGADDDEDEIAAELAPVEALDPKSDESHDRLRDTPKPPVPPLWANTASRHMTNMDDLATINWAIQRGKDELALLETNLGSAKEALAATREAELVTGIKEDIKAAREADEARCQKRDEILSRMLGTWKEDQLQLSFAFETAPMCANCGDGRASRPSPKGDQQWCADCFSKHPVPRAFAVVGA